MNNSTGNNKFNVGCLAMKRTHLVFCYQNKFLLIFKLLWNFLSLYTCFNHAHNTACCQNNGYVYRVFTCCCFNSCWMSRVLFYFLYCWETTYKYVCRCRCNHILITNKNKPTVVKKLLLILCRSRNFWSCDVGE